MSVLFADMIAIFCGVVVLVIIELALTHGDEIGYDYAGEGNSQGRMVKKLPPWTTITIGVAFVPIGAGFVYTLISPITGQGWLAYLGSLSLSAYLLFKSKLQEVKIGHVGVITFFGKRFKHVYLDEGNHWLPFTFLVFFEEVDTKEQTISPPEIEVITVKTPEGAEETIEESDMEVVKIKIDPTVQYVVVDPYLYLSIDFGEMKNALRDQILDMVRSRGAHTGALTLIREEGLSPHLKEDLNTDNNNGQSSMRRWGIEVKRVNITSMIFSDPELIRAYESKPRERLQALGEETEARNLVERTKYISKELEVSTRDAVVIFQRERNKGDHVVVDGVGDAGDLARAAAIVGRRRE